MHVDIQHVTHVFPSRPPRTALQDIRLEIPSGQFTALVGPSGCGKSTLLRLVAGLITPSQGHIRLDGRSPAEVRGARQIAWMAQSPALLPWLNARGNVALAQRFLSPERRPRFSPQEALQRVGLGDIDGVYPHALSGGMQQRLALARLLTLDAGLWLMDEPFAALDELTRERLTTELLDLWQPLHPTVLWVTHNIYEALRLADRVVVLSSQPGRLAADFTLPLARPRQEHDPAFQAAVRRLRAALGLAEATP
ncbi:MAG: ABC transporter ATP-binding protein [Chloroflexi bacterium]|nr:ABC transporter ATP-binding protein [Chloroflexota bacterium]